LSWQNERLAIDIRAEKIAEMKAKIAPYIGKDIRAEDAEGNPLEGYKCYEYNEEDNMVMVGKSDQEERYPIDPEQFFEWQEKAEQEKWDKVPPFKKGMKLLLTKTKPDGSTEKREWTVEDAVEDGGEMHVIVSGDGGAKDKIPYAKLKQLHDNGGEPVDIDEPEAPVMPIDGFQLPEPLDIKMGKNKKDLKDKLTWYEQIKKQYNRLDKYNKTGDQYRFYEKGGNYYKILIGMLGFVALTPAVGLTVGAAVGIQHKRHYARIKAQQEKESKAKAKEKKAREMQALTDLPREHVATL
jgi:hypothetical protein